MARMTRKDIWLDFRIAMEIIRLIKFLNFCAWLTITRIPKI